MALPNSQPPHPNHIPAYIGPGPGLPDACDDRNNHNYPRPATDCTSITPGIMNAVRHGWGLPGGPFPLPEYAQLPCTTHLPNVYTVCYHCWHMNENLQWYKVAVARIARQPPPPANETNHWRGFLTRLCMLCETRERYLIAMRHEGVVAMGTLPPLPAVRARMQSYPENTCTCLHDLNAGRLCRDHRKNDWDATRNRLVQARNRHKRWLFETVAFPFGPPGALRTSSQTRRINRISLLANFCLRACRCGNEVTNGVPQVWQCMACQGIVEVTGTRMLPGFIAAVPPTAAQQINSSSVGAPLRMMRHKSPLTW